MAASGFRYTDLNLGWHFKGKRNTQPSVQTRFWPLFPSDCQKQQVQIVCRLLHQNTLHLLFLFLKVTYSLGKVWQSQGMSFGLRLAPHYACIWVNEHSRGNSGILQTNQGLVRQPENHLLASPDGASHNRECWSLKELKAVFGGGEQSFNSQGWKRGKKSEKCFTLGAVFGCIHRAPSPARRQCWLELLDTTEK